MFEAKSAANSRQVGYKSSSKSRVTAEKRRTGFGGVRLRFRWRRHSWMACARAQVHARAPRRRRACRNRLAHIAAAAPHLVRSLTACAVPAYLPAVSDKPKPTAAGSDGGWLHSTPLKTRYSSPTGLMSFDGESAWNQVSTAPRTPRLAHTHRKLSSAECRVLTARCHHRPAVRPSHGRAQGVGQAGRELEDLPS